MAQAAVRGSLIVGWRTFSRPKVECPTLVVSGDEFPEDRGENVAALYGATLQHFPGFREFIALFLMSHMKS
jgi:hypothetical protein